MTTVCCETPRKLLNVFQIYSCVIPICAKTSILRYNLKKQTKIRCCNSLANLIIQQIFVQSGGFIKGSVIVTKFS